MSLANKASTNQTGKETGHEDFDRHVEVRGSSDRSFGLVMAAFFALLGLGPLTRGAGVRIWAFAVAAVVLTVALVRPGILHLLNVGWGRIGMVLARVTTPIVMGVIFFLIVTPLGVLFRVFGRDPMRLRSKGGDSYWILRQPPGPSPETMRNQF